MRIVCCLFCLALLTGCATMDLNTMDTAIPIYPDRVSISTYVGIGIDYSSPFFKGEEFLDQEQLHSDFALQTDVCQVLKLGIPFNEKYEIQAKAYKAGYSWGAKAGVKGLVYHQGKHYIALMPMLTHISGEPKRNEDDGTEYKDRYRANGLELTALSSHQLSKYFIGSLVARYNVSWYSEESNHIQYEDLTIFHGGLSGNIRVKVKAIILGFEYGVELLTDGELNFEATPFTAIRIGLQF